jgi:hypothetical protein
MTAHRIPLGAILFAVRNRGLGAPREPNNVAPLARLAPADRAMHGLFSEVRARGDWFRKWTALLEYIDWVQR